MVHFYLEYFRVFGAKVFRHDRNDCTDLLLECDDEDVDELDLVLEDVDETLDSFLLLNLI